jgi:hypothetical protein
MKCQQKLCIAYVCVTQPKVAPRNGDVVCPSLVFLKNSVAYSLSRHRGAHSSVASKTVVSRRYAADIARSVPNRAPLSVSTNVSRSLWHFSTNDNFQ